MPSNSSHFVDSPKDPTFRLCTFTINPQLRRAERASVNGDNLELTCPGREAARIAMRANAGMPTFRDRWIGLGAFVLVAAEAVQAMKALS